MVSESVRIFDINYSKEDLKNIKVYIDQVLDEAFLTNHTFCKRLEGAFENICKPYKAISCSSATAGLEAVFRFLKVENKAVLVQSNTFIATAHAIQAAGGVVVPIDLNEEFVMSLNDLKIAVNESKDRGLDIGAVCIVNIAGRASDELIAIQDFCKNRNYKLVEDNAQGMLSTLNQQQLGTFSDFSVSSFQTTKVVACGEGGIILVKDSKNFEALKNFIFYGRDENIPLLFSEVSGNFKLSELNAALALADFERSRSRIDRRREIDRIYSNFVSNQKFFKYLTPPKGNQPSNYKSIFIANNPNIRENIESFFKEKKISMTGYVYKIPIHQQPRVFNSQSFIKRKLDLTEKFSSCHFTPPNYPELTNEKVKYVCECLNNFEMNSF